MYKNFKDIKDIQDACKYLGYPTQAPAILGVPEHMIPILTADYYQYVLTEAANQLANGGKKWIPDFNNIKEEKWSAYWDMETYNDAPPGSGFVLGHGRFVRTCSHVGARRVFFSKAVGQYLCTQFVDVFRVTHKM